MLWHDVNSHVVLVSFWWFSLKMTKLFHTSEVVVSICRSVNVTIWIPSGIFSTLFFSENLHHQQTGRMFHIFTRTLHLCGGFTYIFIFTLTWGRFPFWLMFQMGWFKHQLGMHFCRTRTHGCVWQWFFCWTKQSYRNRLNQTSSRMSSFVWPFLFCWCRPSGQFMGWRSNICYGLINVRLRMDKLCYRPKFYEGVWGGGRNMMIWWLKWWSEKTPFMLKHDDEETEMMDDKMMDIWMIW